MTVILPLQFPIHPFSMGSSKPDMFFKVWFLASGVQKLHLVTKVLDPSPISAYFAPDLRQEYFPFRSCMRSQ